MNNSQSGQYGFTIVEMIVSLAIFAIVVTISVGALLVLIASNEQLQQEQSVMTNLSFALDTMTREIRTGTAYYCESVQSYAAGGPNNIFEDTHNLDVLLYNAGSGFHMTQDCSDGINNSGHNLQGVSFVESGDSITGAGVDRIIYFYDKAEEKIFRRVGAGDRVSIVSSDIRIIDAEFFVTGSDPLDTSVGWDENSRQPLVTIYLQAVSDDDPTGKVHHIQTTVTQRTLDL